MLREKWILAKNGYEIIDRCQTELFEVQAEIQSYAALFTCLGSCEMDESDLYGVGIAMKRIARRLEKSNDRLAQAINVAEVRHRSEQIAQS